MFIWFWIRESLLTLFLGKKKEVFKFPTPSEIAGDIATQNKYRGDKAVLLDHMRRAGIWTGTELFLQHRVVVRERFGIRRLYSREQVWVTYDQYELPKKRLFWSTYDEDRNESTLRFLRAMCDHIGYRGMFATGLIPE